MRIEVLDLTVIELESWINITGRFIRIFIIVQVKLSKLSSINPPIIVIKWTITACEFYIQSWPSVDKVLRGVKLTDICLKWLLTDSIHLYVGSDQSDNSQIINGENCGFVKGISNIHKILILARNQCSLLYLEVWTVAGHIGRIVKSFWNVIRLVKVWYLQRTVCLP